MPSKNKKQHRLMEIVAHTKGGYDDIPQNVGEDFVQADKKRGKFAAKKKHYLKRRMAAMEG